MFQTARVRRNRFACPAAAGCDCGPSRRACAPDDRLPRSNPELRRRLDCFVVAARNSDVFQRRHPGNASQKTRLELRPPYLSLFGQMVAAIRDQPNLAPNERDTGDIPAMIRLVRKNLLSAFL